MPHTTRETDQRYLREAIELAAENARLGRGGPFAALVVHAGRVIARCTNRVTALNDPTAHAEVEAIREACRQLGDYQLPGCTLYASCEPCPMCLGAIYWARPVRVVFAATRHEAAAAGFDDAFIYRELTLPPVDRSIPFEPVDLPEAGLPFDRWREAEGRIDY
ncbi:MAG: nucleoside deaminase [Rhodothermales bacterium]|nr:nucleoside deaminase [Rhodothermales bacterium]